MTVLKIYIDFKSPESYLAFNQTATFAKENSLDISWKPFLTKSRNPPLPKKNETKGETHLRIREEHKKSLNLKYAKILNLPMKYPRDENQSDLALSLLPKLSGETKDYIALAFHYFWQQNFDLNNKDTVIELLKASKKETTVLDVEEDLIQTLIHDTELAKQSGVIATPTYELEGDLFLGREHLPWIKKHLTNNR